MKVEGTVTIRRSIEDVFTYLTDVEKIPLWAPRKIRMLTDGPMGVGSQFSQTSNFLGQSIELVGEVTAYDKPTTYAAKSLSGPFSVEQSYTLSPVEEGTKVELVAEGELGGFFKLAQPLVAAAVNKQIKDVLHNLKQLLEQ